MTDYLNNIRQLKNDIIALGEPFSPAQQIAKIINSLTPAYSGWLERYHEIMSNPGATKPDLKSVEAQLIAVEAQLIAKETTIPKQPKKDRKDKDNRDKSKEGNKEKKPRDKCTYELCSK
ncbi:unnamed protein product [Zymoseptoria tritici ST99CH_1A5]|uniref:Uncharacterized protein n=1 Tax=Zymoseptoria tritici ST99CH_1A5 TaxID=1276529 RepID=A0A1Y6M160_ZYMTR|nr:unnamed protein product [Zymoseptoria tritici ST99CH_3D1]SMY30373.1 unnamed protein product [Zymoseptoria tritici ST99CH_1A5]